MVYCFTNVGKRNKNTKNELLVLGRINWKENPSFLFLYPVTIDTYAINKVIGHHNYQIQVSLGNVIIYTKWNYRFRFQSVNGLVE